MSENGVFNSPNRGYDGEKEVTLFSGKPTWLWLCVKIQHFSNYNRIGFAIPLMPQFEPYLDPNGVVRVVRVVMGPQMAGHYLH